MVPIHRETLTEVKRISPQENLAVVLGSCSVLFEWKLETARSSQADSMGSDLTWGSATASSAQQHIHIHTHIRTRGSP